MSNCHVRELSQVYEAILKDASSTYPTLKAEFEKDLARLLGLVKQRGIGVFLQDLPAVGKHLDRCLSDGAYKLSGLPLTKRYSNRVVIPKFLRGLYLRIFHETGRLKEDYDIEAILFLRQILLMAKKAPFTCSEEKTRTEVQEFYDVDRSLPEPDLAWVSTPAAAQFEETYHGFGKSPYYGAKAADVGSYLQPSEGCKRRRMEALLGILDKVSSILTSTLGCYNPSDWSFKHGPGAVSEASGRPEKFQLLLNGWDDHLDKSFPISSYGYHNLGSWARNSGLGYDQDSPQWEDRDDPQPLGLRFSRRDGRRPKDPLSGSCLSSGPEYNLARGYKLDDDWHRFWDGVAAQAVNSSPGTDGRRLPSRLVAVPKDFRKPRLIAAEPCARQWCQQNCWDYFRGRVGGTWLSKFVRFRDQTRNQALCRRGSLDGSLCTVDLSAASDRVTCHVVGQFFRRNPRLLEALSACRTPILRQNLNPRVPETIELRKFSTMGSACTFPVESLVFLGAALACVLYERQMRVTTRSIRSLAGSVSVFGDDIIIPNESRELFFELLEVLDFKVNLNKSFWTGKFRESCGVDAFDGVDVTPVYWKGSNDGKPESLATAVECSNNFYKKFYLHTSRLVASTVPWDLPMVPMRSGAFGLKTRTRFFLNGMPCRWNSYLHRVEVRVVTILSVQHREPLSSGESALLQYFTEAPSPYDVWCSGTPQKPLTKYRKRWVAIEELVAQAS